MASNDQESTLGAIIFFSYILAALVLTGCIANNLFKAHSTNVARQEKRRHPGLENSIRVCAALSFLSFSILSYHMLSFLILSYQQWSSSAIPLLRTSSLRGNGVLESIKEIPSLRIWAWSKSSTLFQDFAEVIMNEPNRFWWSQLALLYGFGWNIYMAIEGSRYRIPELWLYFILDQILPVSLTQNLFTLATLMSPPPIATGPPSSTRQMLQILLVLLYLISVSTAPHLVGTALFFPVLFACRLLLFLPFYFFGSSSIAVEGSKNGAALSFNRNSKPPLLLLSICGIVLQLLQTFRTTSWSALRSALNQNPAVSTLGYDFLIAIASLVVITSYVGHMGVIAKEKVWYVYTPL